MITCAVGWYLRFSLSYRNVEERLNTAQMNALQEDLHTLCSPQIEHLYAVWKQDGDEGFRAEYALQAAPTPPRIDLTSSVLEYGYDLFGTLHAAS